MTVAIRWAEPKEFVTGGEFSAAYPASSTGFPANILVSSGRCLYASRHGKCSFLDAMAPTALRPPSKSAVRFLATGCLRET